MTQIIQSIRGMNDVLPDDAPLWQFFEDRARTWLASYGYREMRMPLVEATGLFRRAIGEATDIVQKEMYSFTDQLNGDSLTLRPEGTASCVRAALQHNMLYHGALRLYYTGPMFRHERPQKGRYRQFHQIGAEALGFPGPDVDCEHIVMTARLWRLLGLDGVRLELNTLGNAAARAEHRKALQLYFKRHWSDLDEETRKRCETNPLRVLDSKNPALKALIAGAPVLMNFIDAASVEYFEALQAMLADAGIVYEINPRLVRGLDYYNLTVFEWVSSELGAQGTVCAGGRYDTLVQQLGGKPAPACGFALGVERLLALMDAAKRAPDVPDVYLVHEGEAADKIAARMAETMRDAGVTTILHCGGGSFKSQMKKADASRARFAVIIGDDEARAGKVSVKPLRVAGAQLLLGLDSAVKMILQKD